MGAGDAFRVVAQALMGAGGGAANYALERDAELRKQQQLLDFLAAKQKLSPLEEEKLRAEIGALKRRNTGPDSTTKTDSRIEEMIQQEELARGRPFNQRERATVKSRLLQRMVFRPSGTPLLESEEDCDL